MNRPIRIGLIAEGEAELGSSIPYIKPEDGGKLIEPDKEGALHTLIRRELESYGFSDCCFVHRHPTTRERSKWILRTGHSAVLDRKYLAQIVINWKPDEVDIIVILADADDSLEKRQNDLELALGTVRQNHLDAQEKPIPDRSVGGLAIRNFEAWLLADYQTVSKLLDVDIEPIEELEDLEHTKDCLDSIISKSTSYSCNNSNQRPLQIRWDLAKEIDLQKLREQCPKGYQDFADKLLKAASVIRELNLEP